jgi:hypothetical protein
MDDTSDHLTRERMLGSVRATGKVWARRQHATSQAWIIMRSAIRQGRDYGLTVTELADAARVSRKAVYSALRGD